MNEDTLQTIDGWLARGDRVAVATTVRTYRSAPRPLGAIFAVSSSGEMAGSVSGGCVEGAIYDEARDLFDGGAPTRLIHYGVSDDFAFSVGLACGGELWVHLEEHRPRPELRRGAIVLAASGPQAGRRLVVDHDAGTATGDLEGDVRERALAEAATAIAAERSRSVDLEEDGLLFVEAVQPPPRVVVVGGVDTTEAVCRLARGLGWRAVVVDPRGKFATPERLPSADEIVVRWPQDAFPEIGLEAADHVVVLTHDPKVDDPAIVAALEAGCGYIGALGSRRTQAKRRERLAAEHGLDDATLDRIRGPIGLDIGADTPQETGISVIGEIISFRSGRSGAPLVATTGSIHVAREDAT